MLITALHSLIDQTSLIAPGRKHSKGMALIHDVYASTIYSVGNMFIMMQRLLRPVQQVWKQQNAHPTLHSSQLVTLSMQLFGLAAEAAASTAHQAELHGACCMHNK